MGFPDKTIGWIKECVSTASFSVNVDRELCGFFKSERGLRQGDPVSPYLFSMVMEVLSGLIRKASMNSDFGFHWCCKKEVLTHLCFADDLLLL